MKGFSIIVFFLSSQTLAGGSICDNKPCGLNGVCTPSVNPSGYKCSCYPGFTPPNCADRNECSAPHLCQNGTCINNPGSYSCGCNSGYTGRHCEKQEDPCLSNPCLNMGTCQSTAVGAFICRCYVGFDSTKNCADVDECAIVSGLCHNGTCQNTLGSFKCLCSSGYQGKHCNHDLNECDTHPCNINSACMNTAGSYKCMCYPGYGGSNCEDMDECALSRSVCNQGTCVNTPGSFKCVCPAGYSTPRCKDINECLNSPCKHGSCYNTQGSFQCNCDRGYQGKLCNEKTVLTSTLSSTTFHQVVHIHSLSQSTTSAPSFKTPFGVKTAKTSLLTIEKSASTSIASSTAPKTSLSSEVVSSTSYKRPQNIVSSSTMYFTSSKKHPSSSQQEPISTASKRGNGQIANSLQNTRATKQNVPWTKSHWYIFVLVGVGLVTGIVLSVILIKKRQRNTTINTNFDCSNELITSTMYPSQQENPLYMAFHGHEAGASDL